MCVCVHVSSDAGSKAGSYLRLRDFCITRAKRPARRATRRAMQVRPLSRINCLCYT